jgi:uncharacterized membrane protein
MIGSVRLLTRIALFSALIYVFSLVTSYLPNVNLVFFIVFSAGFLWGALPGVLVGAIGMGLWTLFNPYGPAPFPIMAAQILGASISGLIGAMARAGNWLESNGFIRQIKLAILGAVCTILFFLPVSVADAWLYQPFWPRLITSASWSLISLVTNLVIFPLLFGVTRLLYDRERISSWHN